MCVIKKETMENRERIILERNWLKFILLTILAIGLVILGLNFIDTWYGIGAIILGLGAFYLGKDVEFRCSYCDKKLEVSIFKENVKCKKCETLYVIDWENSK